MIDETTAATTIAKIAIDEITTPVIAIGGDLTIDVGTISQVQVT
jgi:hypothetical protein